MLIKMIDGGIVNYEDDCYFYGGCPTCDYGSEYINEIDITLTRHKIHVETNQMYEYALSAGKMIKLFLSEYNTIQAMNEQGFIDWFKEKLNEITKDIYANKEGLRFDVTEIVRPKYKVHLCARCIKNLDEYYPYLMPRHQLEIVGVAAEKCDNNNLDSYNEKLTKRNPEWVF